MRTIGRGVDSCLRTTWEGGGWVPEPIPLPASSEGMRDGSPHSRGHGRGWVLPAFSRGWDQCGDDGGDGSPHARGQREGVDSCLRLHGGGFCVGGRMGWVPACARTTGGGGFLPASSRGWVLRGRMDGMGPRMREDNGRGWIPACVFTGRLCAGMTEGMGARAGFKPARYGIDCNVGVNCTSRAYSRSSGIQRGWGVHGGRRFWAFSLRMRSFWAGVNGLLFTWRRRRAWGRRG